VISQGAFADLIVCLTQFSKNHKFQKKSLQAIEMLKSTVPKMLRTPECPLSARSGKAKDAPTTDAPSQPTQQTEEEQFWFPVLFAFHDVLMTGDDLEVRSRYVKSCDMPDHVLTTSQSTQLSFRHPYEVWQAIPS
jgi:brefeldin A-inhibited guanine nucleotide-exchange protein